MEESRGLPVVSPRTISTSGSRPGPSCQILSGDAMETKRAPRGPRVTAGHKFWRFTRFPENTPANTLSPDLPFDSALPSLSGRINKAIIQVRLSVQGETSQGGGGVQKDTERRRGPISSPYLFKETIWTGQTIPRKPESTANT